jgi:hypothetical protein
MTGLQVPQGSNLRQAKTDKEIDLKMKLFSPIGDREAALALAKDCGNAFFAIAAIQGLMGALVMPSVLADAVVFALCGYFVRFKQSRVAAVVGLLLSALVLWVTVSNRLGQSQSGGSNLILAVVITIAAVRGVEAIFKLHGRFAGEVSEAQQQ